MINLRLLTYVTLALTTLVSTAHAEYDPDDAREAYESTVLKREVTYQCQNDKEVTVTYGFNKQKLPTYATSNIGGKDRFMPINLSRSDNVDTLFGDENNYSLMTGGTSSFRLATYHKLSMNLMNPASEMVFKGCDVKYVRKLK